MDMASKKDDFLLDLDVEISKEPTGVEDLRDLWDVPFVPHTESFDSYSSLLRAPDRLNSENLAEIDDSYVESTDKSTTSSTDRSKSIRGPREHPNPEILRSSTKEDTEKEDIIPSDALQRARPSLLNLIQGNSIYERRIGEIGLDSSFLQILYPFGSPPNPEELGLFSCLIPKKYRSQPASSPENMVSKNSHSSWGFHTGLWSKALRLHNKKVFCRYHVKTKDLNGTWYGTNNYHNAHSDAWAKINAIINPFLDNSAEGFLHFEALAADFFDGKEVLDPAHYYNLPTEREIQPRNTIEASDEIDHKDNVATSHSLPTTDSGSATTKAFTPTTSDTISTVNKSYKIEHFDVSERVKARNLILYGPEETYNAGLNTVNVFLMDCSLSNEVEDAICEIEKQKSMDKTVMTVAKVHDTDFRRSTKFFKLDKKLTAWDNYYKKLAIEPSEHCSAPVTTLQEIVKGLNIKGMDGAWTLYEVHPYTAEGTSTQKRLEEVAAVDTIEESDELPQVKQDDGDHSLSMVKFRQEPTIKKKKPKKKRYPKKVVKSEQNKIVDSEDDDMDQNNEAPPPSTGKMPTDIPIASDPRNYDFTDSINSVFDDAKWEVVKPKTPYKAKPIPRNQQQSTSTNFQTIAQQQTRNHRQVQSQSFAGVQGFSQNSHPMPPKPNTKSIQTQKSSSHAANNSGQLHVESLNDFPSIPSSSENTNNYSQRNDLSAHTLSESIVTKAVSPTNNKNAKHQKDFPKKIISAKPIQTEEKGSLELTSATQPKRKSGRNASKTQTSRTQHSNSIAPKVPQSPNLDLASTANVSSIQNRLASESVQLEQSEVAASIHRIPAQETEENFTMNANLAEAHHQSGESTNPIQVEGPSHLSESLTIVTDENAIGMFNYSNGRHRSSSTTERYFDPSSAMRELQYSDSASNSPVAESSRSVPVTRVQGGYLDNRANNFNVVMTPIISSGASPTTMLGENAHLIPDLSRTVSSNEPVDPMEDVTDAHNDSSTSTVVQNLDLISNEGVSQSGIRNPQVNNNASTQLIIHSPESTGFQTAFIGSASPVHRLSAAGLSENRVAVEPSNILPGIVDQSMPILPSGWSQQGLSTTVLNPSTHTHLGAGSPGIEFYCSHCYYKCYGTAQNPIVLCHGCGITSNIRYCSIACLLANSLAHYEVCIKTPEVSKLFHTRFPIEYLYFNDYVTVKDNGDSPETHRQKAFNMYCSSGPFPQLFRAWARRHNVLEETQGQDSSESLNKTGTYFIFKSRATGDGYRPNPDSTAICTITLPPGDFRERVLIRCLDHSFMFGNRHVKEFLFRFLRDCLSKDSLFNGFPHTEVRSVVLAEFHHQFRREFNFDAAMQFNLSDEFDFQSEWHAVEGILDELEMCYPWIRRWMS